jgi:nucleoside-diphosphate-sugar epimerase
MSAVYVTGGTGYIGRRLIPMLLGRGHTVRALVREGSQRRLPAGCHVVVGDPLKRTTFESTIEPDDTVVQLVGVPHPSPLKAQQFFDIDLVSARETIAAARARGAGHFVYVSVAQPAPVMQAYQTARADAEGHLAHSGLPATILRPFYVLGPGHRWPMVLVPIYALLERLPRTRPSALRLGLVTIEQMVAALVLAVEFPPEGTRFFTVPDIRKARL